MAYTYNRPNEYAREFKLTTRMIEMLHELDGRKRYPRYGRTGPNSNTGLALAERGFVKPRLASWGSYKFELTPLGKDAARFAGFEKVELKP